MLRQHPLLFFISTLFLATLACNAFAGEAEPELSVPPPLVTIENGTAVPNEDPPIANIAPTSTLPGSSSGDGTAVATDGPTLTVLVDLNIRSGPGVVYERLGFFLQGDTAQVLGIDPASGWWLVACPSNIAAAQCWVSGGSQYTLGSNTDAVPVAAAPPTPTPVPTAVPTIASQADTAVLDGLNSYIVYSDTDGIWLLSLDNSQSPPAALEPVQLVSASDINRLFISPNGQQIAFTAGEFDSNRLGVVSIGGNGQTLAKSSDLPNTVGENVAILIDRVAWLPDSQTVAFSSAVANLEGPGYGPQADLWLVTNGSSPTEQFAPGTGGHTFALSPDGTRLIFGNPESMTRVNMDGSNRETVITFPFVNTASEYAWVPTAQWLPSGSQAYVAIADDEPWTDEAEATLYQIPVSGPAIEIGSVPGNTLFSSPNWTRSASRLGYTQLIVGPDNAQTVAIAEGDGSNLISYASSEQLTFSGWNRSGTHFIYADQFSIGIGQEGKSPVEVLTAGRVDRAVWLNDTLFVASIRQGGSGQLIVGNLAGNTTMVAETAADSVSFDVWAP